MYMYKTIYKEYAVYSYVPLPKGEWTLCVTFMLFDQIGTELSKNLHINTINDIFTR